MPIDSHTTEILACMMRVEQIYASLMYGAAACGEANLGGKLLYAGELDESGRALAIAGNIAGAATLAASADPASLRQAQRDGAIDFLVNSLDEALRILKNEIRKREPVAVAVSAAPAAVSQEMLDRGVLPDLLPPQLPSAPDDSCFTLFIAQGAQRIAFAPSHQTSKFLIWPIPIEFTQRPAAFEALLLEHLPPSDVAAIRWLRLSSRYLGPQFRRLRSLQCSEEVASKLIEILGNPL